MITVTGATGRLGGAVVEELLRSVPPADVSALVRAPDRAADLHERGVDLRAGDYDDPGSLRAAFAGTDVLFFVSSPDTTPGTRPRQHGNVVDAAVAAGVGRVVYTSAIGADDGPGFLADHTVTEGLLRDSGLPVTLLRNTFYLSALVNPGLKAVAGAGVLKGADQGRRVNFASIPDLAAASAAALTGEDHAGNTYELRGPVWTLPELADVVGELTGREVAYRGVPSAELGGIGFVHDLIASGLFAEPSGDLEHLLGRPPIALRDAVRAALV